MKSIGSVSLYKKPPARQSTGLRPEGLMNVQFEGLGHEKYAPVPNILRDTKGNPLWDTGYGVITAQPLSSGMQVTVENHVN
jgi:hypothetical protein